MIKKLSLIAILGLTLMLNACAVKFGTDFNPKSFQDWVKRGQTSRSEVIKYLGPPTSQGVVVLGDGTVLKRILYYYGNGQLNEMEKATFKMLEIRFDSNDKVYSFNYSSSKK